MAVQGHWEAQAVVKDFRHLPSPPAFLQSPDLLVVPAPLCLRDAVPPQMNCALRVTPCSLRVVREKGGGHGSACEADRDQALQGTPGRIAPGVEGSYTVDGSLPALGFSHEQGPSRVNPVPRCTGRLLASRRSRGRAGDGAKQP
jgi:hypothetical protein